MKRSHLKKGDVLLSIVGTIGGVSLVSSDNEATCSCKLAILRPKTQDANFYLPVFLKSKYGQNQIKKFTRGAVQMGLILEDFDQIFVPELDKNLENRISVLVTSTKEKLNLSKEVYLKAENLLLETVGLVDFEPSKEKTNIKSFSSSFLSTGRLDAEYYQLKYEDYLKIIIKYPNGYGFIKNICAVKDENYNPDEIEEYKYIELADIGKSGEITGCTVEIGSELPSRARRKVNENDVIVSSIEGSLESCALILKEYDDALCSNGFYVVNSDVINSETLLVLFKSELMQNILKQRCSGTILTAINKTEFFNIPLPLIDDTIQMEIKSKVLESFRLRKESENLIEVAKRAVEIAIEETEEKAIEFINAETR